MKLKLTGSTFAALIVYMLTALIGLIQFNPLSSVLISGVKFALTAFVFTFLITYAMEIMNKKTQATNQDSSDDNKQKQPQGKSSREYEKTKASQNQANAQEESTGGEQQKEDKDNEENNWDFEDDFSEMEPPVIEYEKNN
ncbi:MAG TPA: hypothetical protein VKN64_07140 [Halanaerobiales bacterium]|nr:hypothetical protein [Halanaerobiales bacterium]